MNIRNLFRYIIRSLLFLAAAILLYYLAALVFSIIPTRPKTQVCASTSSYFITTNGIHLDVVVPKDFFAEDNWAGLTIPDRVQYVAVGWGDKGFYLETPTWDDLKLSTALQALFWKSETAMHLTYYTRKPTSWRAIELCPEQIADLQTYMLDSFEKTKDGRVMEILGAGYTDSDLFFEAVGNYSVFRTCNNWANQALKAAGVKTAVWSPFDWGVLRYR